MSDPASQETFRQRVVRVFVSSTFSDMHAERDELARRVFPQLRKLCEGRGITWTGVDLRWGITDEQAARGEVLPICLEEINTCRPFFIGLLGERYGSLPQQGEITDDLIAKQPWLAEHIEHSVTELEILHGVLNDPAMANRACFYFRDPAYVQTIGPEDEDKFIESDPAGRDKLSALKDRIRKSGLALCEDYSDPQALGEMVLADLTAAIDQEFPPGTEPDPLDAEAAEHEAFAVSRSRVYIGRKEYFARLDDHAAGDGEPLVVLGESGSGKSALLANWALAYGAAHPDQPLLVHFTGASAYSADWAALLRRIMGELKRRFDIDGEIPTKPDALRAEFANWLHMAAARGRVVLVLDALNQLEDRDQAPDLVWLPPMVPPSIRLIVSTLPGRSMDALTRRGWPTMTVKPLKAGERRRFIGEYLKTYTQSLDKARTARTASAAQSANPLFLQTLLDELRIVGRYELLDDQINGYLAAEDVPQLYERILARYEGDYDRDRPYLVRDAMTLIWAARRGLSESELLDLLGSEGEPLPRAHWSPLHVAADRSLLTRSGLINFSHDYLRQAVENRYLSADTDRREAHTRLADYFAPRDLTARKVDELPWQLARTDKLEQLKNCLVDLDMFLKLFTKTRQYELLGYWLQLDDAYDKVAKYTEALNEYETAIGTGRGFLIRLANVAEFLRICADFTGAEPLMRRSLAIAEESFGADHPDVATTLNNLAGLFHNTNRWAEAEPLFRRALAIDEASFGPDHPKVAIRLSNLALLLQDMGRLREAEPLMCRALAIEEASFGPDHPKVTGNLICLADLLKAMNRTSEVEPLVRRALAIDEQAFGPDHPEVAGDLKTLAQFLKATNRPLEAEQPMRRALAIDEQSFGPGHPAVAGDLNTLAQLLKATGRSREAERLMHRSLSVYEQLLGPDHSTVGVVLNNLALLLMEMNRPSEAEPLVRRALAINERSCGPDHPTVAATLHNLAQLLHGANRLSEAEPLMRRALAIDEVSFGPDHPKVGNRLNNLAALLMATNRPSEAASLSQRQLEIFLKFTAATGHQHPHLCAALDNYEILLQATGRTRSEAQQEVSALLERYGVSLR